MAGNETLNVCNNTTKRFALIVSVKLSCLCGSNKC